jgi:hypothetical protein
MSFIQDPFTRANAGTLGANWTEATGSAGYEIVSNAATNIGAGNALTSYTNVLAPVDQYSQCKLITITGTTDEGPGPAVRASTTAITAYFLQANTVEVRLYRAINNASFIKLGLDFAPAAANDTLKLTAVGSGSTVTLEYFKNGVSQGTRTDAPGDGTQLISGNYGLWYGVGGAAQTVVVDDWEGGDLGGPTGLVSFSVAGLRPNAFAPGLAR